MFYALEFQNPMDAAMRIRPNVFSFYTKAARERWLADSDVGHVRVIASADDFEVRIAKRPPCTVVVFVEE